MNIILLGAPGAGKGTQAEVICKALNIPTISTGNMLRAAVKAGTEYGLKAEALDAMGVKIDKVIEIYVPDETIQQRLSGRRVCLDCGATYHTAFKPSKVEGVCDVCGKPIVIRKDDEPATVISRLQTYHKSTAPLKDYYGKQGKLVTVEGQDKVEDTSKLVLEAVKA